MQITFDPVKRNTTLAERKLVFADAAEVFAGHTYDQTDDRFDYGEVRTISVGRLAGRMVVVVLDAAWRGSPRHFDEESQ